MSLLDFFRKNKDPKAPAPEEVCPNCWGKQEYGGQFIELAADRQIDISNGDSSSARAFIQEFVTTHVEGIRLKKQGDTFACPTCQAGSKTVKPKV